MTNSAGRPSLLIRADAGISIGAGHVVRSLTIAGLLQERGIHTDFAIRADEGAWLDRIAEEGHGLVVLPSEPVRGSLLDGPLPDSEQQRDLEQVMARTPADYSAVIVDHYGLNATWERGIRARSRRILAIDDLANREHAVDVLVDHNWYGPDTANRYAGLVPSGCLQLLGPRYAILQGAYGPLRARSVPPAQPPKRVLVSFGGSDPTGETAKVLEALAGDEFSDIVVDVVLGNRFVLSQKMQDTIVHRPRTHLHIGLPTLAELLSQADLAIGASGSGTWERMCLGVPAVVTTTTLAHSGVTKALADAGLTTWAGVGGEVDAARYADLIRSAMGGQLPASPPLVDGIGASRIAEALFPTLDALVTLRPATPHDAPLFLGADPGGPPTEPRQLGGPDAWRDLEAQFHNDLAHPTTVLLVVALGNTSVGRAHARLRDEIIHVSFALVDAVAGRDLGGRVGAALARTAWTVTDDALTWAGPSVAVEASSQAGDGNLLFGSFDIPAGTIAAEDDGK